MSTVNVYSGEVPAAALCTGAAYYTNVTNTLSILANIFN